MAAMPRRCAAKNKAGKPCQAAPLRGKKHCSAHDPQAPPSTRFGSPEQAAAAGPLGGRPRKPSPSEIARRLVEANEAIVLRPAFKILGYDIEQTRDGLVLVESPEGGAKLHSSFKGDVYVSGHDDLGAMLAAAETLQDRLYGKPKVTAELTGAGGSALSTELILDPELAEGARELLRRAASSRKD